LLGWLSEQAWFFAGLGAAPDRAVIDATALVLFMLVAPVFFFLLGPLSHYFSRRDEFAADAFATRHTARAALITALTKLYRDNAAPLSSDPLYSAAHDSHPPAAERIARLSSASGY